MADRRCTRLIRPEEDGSFSACAPEYPGCFAIGDTPLEALENLEGTIIAWTEACLSLGQDIPEFDHRAWQRWAEGEDVMFERCAYKRALEEIAEVRTEILDSQDMAEDWYRELACRRRMIASCALDMKRYG